MARMQDLPAETVRHLAGIIKSDPEEVCERLVSLSGTCSYMRAAVMPHLWRNISLRIEFKSLSTAIAKMQALTLPHHPIHEYARDLQIVITPQYLTEEPYSLEELDALLAKLVASVPQLMLLRIEGHTPRFNWQQTMNAVVCRSTLQRLVIAGTTPIHLLPTEMPAVTYLALEGFGRCFFDLSCFPSVESLTLGMEDMDTVENWQQVRFPPSLWASLKSLSMRGYCKDPGKLLNTMKRSLKVGKRTFRMK